MVSLVPIWSVGYHPLPDLANHMAAASVWTHLHDPKWDFERYYELNLGLNPYWGYYAPMRVLAPIFGVNIANRLVLSLYVTLLPFGTLWLALRLDRSRWIALFAFPFIWTFCFTFGFIHTSIGLALVPGAVAAFDWFCERPTIPRGIVAGVLGAAIYFCHVVPFLLYLGCAGLIGLLHRDRSLARMAARLAVWCSTFAIGLVVSLFGHGKGMGTTPSHYTFSWDRHPIDLLLHAYDWTWNNCTGHEDEILAVILALGWLALRLTVRPRWSRNAHDYRAHAIVTAAVLGYLILPKSVLTPSYSWGVKYRIAAWAVMFLAYLIPGEIAGWRRLLMIPVAVAGFGFAVDAGLHWRTANRFTSGFDEVSAAIPSGSRALFILGKPFRDPAVVQGYVQSWPSYFQALHGGFNEGLFDDFPLHFRERFPAPTWQSMAFNWEQHAPYYDYVVTFQTTGAAVFRDHLPAVTQVEQAGKWTVWKLPGPRIDVPPGPAYPAEWANDPKWRPAR
ncbi:MAG TPA: hypothetical protein VIA18_14240 [Polyangia bacterium]|nr:hypothetical protein [Polyangia bacterium]